MSDNNNNNRNTRPVPANDPGSIPLQIFEDDAATLVSRDISCDEGDFSVMTPMPTVLHRPTVSRGGDSVARPNTSSRNAAATAANVNASNNTIREDETNNIPNQEGHHDTDESELAPSRQQQQQQDIDGAVEETASQNRPNGFAASSYDDFETALEEDARAKAAAGKTTAANSRTATDGDAKQKGKTGLLVDGDGAASTASSKDGKMIDGDGASSSAVAVAASSLASQFSDEPASRGTSVPASSTTSRTSTTQPTAQNLSSHPGAYSIDNPLYNNNNQNNTANNDNDDPPSRALSEQESLLLVQASLVQESSVGTNIMRQTYGELVQASPILELPPQAQDASSENVVISRRSIKLAALIGCFMLIALAVGIGVVAAVSGGDDDDDDGSNDFSTFSLESSSSDSDANNPTASPSVSTFVTVGGDDTSLLATISPSKITEDDTTAMPTMVSSEEEDLEESEEIVSTILPTSLSTDSTLGPTINNDTEISQFTTLVPTTSALSENSGLLSNATINATLDEVSDLTDLIPAAVAELSTASPSPALPTFAPSEAPTTLQPSEAPTTLQPSGAPTSQPTLQPSLAPSLVPSLFPTTIRPTTRPTFAPTKPPTLAPTPRPTLRPTQRPPRPTNPNNNPAPGPPPPNNPIGGGNNGGGGGGGQGGMQRALEEVNRLHIL